MPVDVKQQLRLLRSMNPAVVTKGAAETCAWAADIIEKLAAYAHDSDRLIPSRYKPEVKDLINQLLPNEPDLMEDAP